MTFDEKLGKKAKGGEGRETRDAQVSKPGSDRDLALFDGDAAVDEVLRDFNLSVRAWSEAAYNRPRALVKATPHQRAWRRATGWALGCVLAAGAAGGGIYERHHRQEMARIAAAREAEQQRLVAEQRAREAEDLLARVDSDVSREVPNAMEPLAQLMAEDESR
jgi:hypothetical protein